MKGFLLWLGKYLSILCFKLALSFLSAWAVSGPVIEAATNERGYAGAYGGEWLLIIGAFVLTYYLATKGCNAFMNPKPKKIFKSKEENHVHDHN